MAASRVLCSIGRMGIVLAVLVTALAMVALDDSSASSADWFRPPTVRWLNDPSDATLVRWAITPQLLVVQSPAHSVRDSVTLFDLDTIGRLTPLWTTLVPNNPAEIRTGDLNNDGTDDAVIPSLSDTVTILFGNAGAMPTVKKILLYHSPISTAIADINHDGTLDLTVGHDGAVSFLLNDGAGNFTVSQRIGLRAVFGFRLSPADFNRDGHVDFVGGHAYASGLHLFFGDGTGQFTYVRRDAVPSNVFVIAADFTGDGIADVLGKNYGTSELFLFRGHGDGTFHDPMTTWVTTGSVWIDAADFDRDGDLDVVTGADNGKIAVLVNDGMGHLSHESTLQIPPARTILRAQDVNVDGWMDLVVCTLYTDSIYVFLNRAQPTTAVLAEPPATTLIEDGIEVRWRLGEEAGEIHAERFDPLPRQWLPFEGMLHRQRDVLRLIDRSVVRGQRHGYRLRENGEAFGEVWVDVPWPRLRVTASPNPTLSAARVRVTGLSGDAELDVFDVTGRRVFARRIDRTTGEQGVVVPASPRLGPGVYRVRVLSANQSAESKLVILR
jgi:hypothetical protein